MKRRFGLDPIERVHLGLGVGVLGAAAALGGGPLAASVATGAAIEACNYRLLRRAADRLFGGELGGRRGWVAGYAVRFTLVGLAMALALRAGARPMGLGLGLSLIVPAAIVVAWRWRPPREGFEPAPPPDDPSWDRWDAWRARERPLPEDEEEAG